MAPSTSCCSCFVMNTKPVLVVVCSILVVLFLNNYEITIKRKEIAGICIGWDSYLDCFNATLFGRDPQQGVHDPHEPVVPLISPTPSPKQQEEKLAINPHIIPVFYGKNKNDLPNIMYELNKAGAPYFSFYFSKYTVPEGDQLEETQQVKERRVKAPLGIVLALCATDRIDVVDKNLLNNVLNDEVSNAVMVLLRRGTDIRKFKTIYDSSINSGVGDEKVLIQFVYFNSTVMDAPQNHDNVNNLIRLADLAFKDTK